MLLASCRRHPLHAHCHPVSRFCRERLLALHHTILVVCTHFLLPDPTLTTSLRPCSTSRLLLFPPWSILAACTRLRGHHSTRPVWPSLPATGSSRSSPLIAGRLFTRRRQCRRQGNGEIDSRANTARTSIPTPPSMPLRSPALATALTIDRLTTTVPQYGQQLVQRQSPASPGPHVRPREAPHDATPLVVIASTARHRPRTGGGTGGRRPLSSAQSA